MANKIIAILFCFAGMGTAALLGGEFKTIWGGKERNIDEGCTFYNKYCHTAFINPSRFGSQIKTGDFIIMPRMDVEKRPTLDENEAKIRLFFKPDVTVRTTGRRNQALIGKEDWKISRRKDGVVYTRLYERGSAKLAAEVTVRMDPQQAQMLVDCKLTNTGSRACQAEAMCTFSFLKNDVSPMHLLLERKAARYNKNYKRIMFFHNEVTRMDGRTQTYWWRRVAKNVAFSNYFNRERIPFDQERLVPPRVMAAAELAGGNTLIWDLHKTEPLSLLDVSWEAECGYITPVWQRKLEPGSELKISYRVITVKKLPRVDVITEKWLLAYVPKGDELLICPMPLQPSERTSITTMVNDENGAVLINQRNEVPSMTPFTPAKVDLRSSVPFKLNNGYPIKLNLSFLEDNSKILDIADTIIP